ncbi:hypothetical protein DF268_45835 [Streptomyces sp. V2]|uniref:Uncharacterized protein n=1 Tax=Streptomyces niveiscabiei TaxID=164115 RepID=A0ABW9HL80_9ACTN|nr:MULTISPECIES: hypothetical protein [Streptomyces]MDX3387079.1 hypothetical protein [Streptomyces niveiscabiei]PWG06980.1 hypothetical protein DF268_45835 [Streptomyces sp. V2]QZZ28203.1 hypothetical protein A7X85_19750 [Streptomyces sp. ST1015]
MTEMDHDALVEDLRARTKEALIRIASLVSQTGIPYTFGEVVSLVEEGLPPDYPHPTRGILNRENMITDMAYTMFKGHEPKQY